MDLPDLLPPGGIAPGSSGDYLTPEPNIIRIRHPFARLVTMKPRKVRSEAFSEGVAGATTTAP